jgi:hypothetical protein
MPKVTNAFDTYTAKGNREDLSNIIYNISPTETPVMSSIGRRNATNVTFDWQTESLPTVDLNNAKEEGFELARSTSTATVRPTNVVQISERDATVTGSQQKSNAAGKANEMARQMSIASKALKRDMESILCQNQAKVAGNASTARKTRALEHWLATNVSRGATGATAVSETAVMTDGTQRAFSETLLKAALQQSYTAGAEPSIILVGPVNKVKLSDFTGRSQARQNVGAETIQQAVSVYASDFGDIKVVPSRFNRERTALLLDPEYAKVAFFRNFEQQEMAKIGDADTRVIVAEWGLEVSNEAAHAAIFDLTTT